MELNNTATGHNDNSLLTELGLQHVVEGGIIFKDMEKAPKIGIYKLTSPSGSIYIGQSWNIEHRMMNYKNHHCKDQPELKIV